MPGAARLVLVAPSIAAVLLCGGAARAAGGGEGARPAFDPGKAGFEVKVKDEVNPYRVLGVYLLPGERLPVQIGPDEKGEFEVRASSGTLDRESPKKWAWVAPGSGSAATLTIERKESGALPGATMTLNVFMMIPRKQIKGGYLNGYRIGDYPATPLRGLAIYRPPAGFVAVTAANRDTPISPHFTLGQFLCKQESGYPKYLILRERLLLKLEYLLEAVNARGIRADGFHVMSGFRTPWYNAAIKNVRYSRHMWGGAADIFVDESPRDGRMDDLNGDGKSDNADAAFLYDFIESLGLRQSYQRYEGGLGNYGSTEAHGPFVHVDARGFRARWGR